MIGKVTKEVLFAKKTLPDLKAMQILMRVPDRKDDTIMLAIREGVSREELLRSLGKLFSGLESVRLN